jgi:hypothetical protein
LTTEKLKPTPPTPEELPPEDRDIYLKQLGKKDWTEEEKAMTEGTIKQEDKEKSAVNRIRNEAIKSWGEWAEHDTFNIEMRDGSTVTYKRISIPEMELDELEQLRIQSEGSTDMDGKPLTPIQQYHMDKLWRDKQAEYYLFNTKTKKMMTPSERLNAKHAFEIKQILTSCQFRSKLEAPEGKN